MNPPSPHHHRQHNPHKRQRLEAPLHHDPSFSDLAHDRLASRAKLRNTWEDLITKYSSIPDDEADEIDLDTGEIVVDKGHLKSLADSVLWATDSDPEDDENVASPHNAKVETPPPDVAPELQSSGLPSEEEIIKQFGEEYGREILGFLQQRKTAGQASRGGDMWRPREDEEAVFARANEIWAAYSARRAAERAAAPDEDEGEERVFDKTSFERAVFGICSDKTFEEIIFGQVSQEGREDGGEGDMKEGLEEDLAAHASGLFEEKNEVEDATSEAVVEAGEKEDVLDAKRAFEEAVFGQIFESSDPEEIDDGDGTDDVIEIPGFEPKHNPKDTVPNQGLDLGESTERKRIVSESIPGDETEFLKTYGIDDKGVVRLRPPPPPTAPPPPPTPLPTTAPRRPEIIDLTTPSPIKPRHPSATRSRKPSTSRSPRSRKRSTSRSSSRRRSVSRGSWRGSVVSGLVDASDEEDDDFFAPSSGGWSVSRGSVRRSVIRIESDGEVEEEDGGVGRDVGREDGGEGGSDGGDTPGRCGDVGYRCSKAFCFQCVS
jgi:Centromere protein Scm3